MKLIGSLALFVSLLPAAQNPANPAVQVCLHEDRNIRPDVLWWSEMTAQQIFEEIGVRLQWGCDTPGAINVLIADRTPDDFMKGALAFARPFARDGLRVTLFYDRCEFLMTGSAINAGKLLGHVLAHEVGHVLAGVDAHDDTGVMRAHWTAADIRDMQGRTIGFAPGIARLIQLNLRSPAHRQPARY